MFSHTYCRHVDHSGPWPWISTEPSSLSPSTVIGAISSVGVWLQSFFAETSRLLSLVSSMDDGASTSECLIQQTALTLYLRFVSADILYNYIHLDYYNFRTDIENLQERSSSSSFWRQSRNLETTLKSGNAATVLRTCNYLETSYQPLAPYIRSATLR
ncbi:hypothetical protein CPB83DRAFT_190587 [Crepidotus variabilis]|uniref:Uncharacterized protein n=1 Tax=Crepidotus variabilis TaxID=179855 RepID=A0A9P6JRY3_9AGAR|nr:hypothetical protein CPB83DRAFT_190587 [Crepidotus variabilis]